MFEFVVCREAGGEPLLEPLIRGVMRGGSLAPLELDKLPVCEILDI